MRKVKVKSECKLNSNRKVLSSYHYTHGQKRQQHCVTVMENWFIFLEIIVRMWFRRIETEITRHLHFCDFHFRLSINICIWQFLQQAGVTYGHHNYAQSIFSSRDPCRPAVGYIVHSSFLLHFLRKRHIILQLCYFAFLDLWWCWQTRWIW